MQEGGKAKMGYPGVRLRVKTAETQRRKVGAEAIWFFQTMFYRTAPDFVLCKARCPVLMDGALTK
jgi:hypothetical protein